MVMSIIGQEFFFLRWFRMNTKMFYSDINSDDNRKEKKNIRMHVCVCVVSDVRT